MNTQNKRLTGIALGALSLLLIPFIAMQFTNEVSWNRFDFVLMGALLFVTGLTIEGVLRFVKDTTYRIAICAAILFIFFLIWAELAVGIFGTPFAGS